MNKLNNEELILVKGGGITSTFLNSLSRLMENIYKLGQAVGSSIRRITSKNVCSLS